MNNVKLPPADRKVFAERIGRPIPDPNSDEFDDLLEDLRSMKPDVYAELIEKLEYVGEALPVEKEAKLASRRSALQHVIDRVRNRQTHDGKTVSDRRKLIIGGLVGVGALFLWMTFSSFQSPYSPGEARAQTPPKPKQGAQSKNAPPEHDFGVRAPRAQLAANLNVPSMPEVAAAQRAAPSADLPPRTATEEETTVSATDSTDTRASSTDLPPRDSSDLPPRPTPVTSSASTVPTNPYAPPTATAQTISSGVPTTPEMLPTSLSFEQARQAEELPTTLSSPSTADTATQTGLEGVALSTTAEAVTQPERAGSLSWEGESATAPDATTTLRWDEPDTQTQAATTLAVPQTSESLPDVPQVATPPSDAQAPASRTQPQPVNLANALTTGSELEAKLVTAVAATGGQGTPVLAKTTGKWCQRQQCPEITWIGEANYDGAARINIVFFEAVVDGKPQAVTATAFDTDRLPGIVADVGDGAPTAIQDLLRGAVGGASDYLNAINTRTTTTVQDGVIVQEEAEPDLGNVLLGRSASLFALPTDQTSVIRYASLDEGKTITLIYGIDL